MTADWMADLLTRRVEQVVASGADGQKLEEIQDDAAREYAAAALWDRLPGELAGDTGPEAVRLRAERAEAAATLWLAAEQAAQRLAGGGG